MTTWSQRKRQLLGSTKAPGAGPASYDYVICGGGTAGCDLASYLAAAGFSVQVLEAGEDTRTEEPVLTVGSATIGTDTKYNHVYPIIISPMLGTAAAGSLSFYPFAEGRGWGGSSAHHFFLAVRGTDDCYSAWAAVNARWSYANLLPIHKALETYTPGLDHEANGDQRGDAGPVDILQTGEATIDGNDFVTALGTAANAPYVEDYNDPSLGVLGTGESQLYIRFNGEGIERSYSANAFLSDVVTGADGDGTGENISILSGALVERLLFDDAVETTRVTGVRYVKDGRAHEVLAHVKVIVCAGAIESPAILQRSGIGPSELLESLGITVRVANDNVGANMQNHFGAVVRIDSSPGSEDEVPECVAFLDLEDSGERDAQFIVGSMGPGSILAVELRPPSNGTVRIRSKELGAQPLVDLGYATDQATWMARMVKIVKKAADVSLEYSGYLPTAPPPASFPSADYGSPANGDPGAAADDTELEDWILANAFPLNHNSGSCRMSTTAETGVVDGALDVHGVEGLAVCDNSVVPKVLDGNTCWSAFVVGAVKAKIEIEAAGLVAPF